MLYGDTLTLIKQKITNIVVFESICSSGVMSEWGFVRVGFGPSGVMSSGVMSEWGFVQWGYVRLPKNHMEFEEQLRFDKEHTEFC